MKKYLLSLLLFITICFCNTTTASNWDLLKPGKRWNIILISYPNEVKDSTAYFVKFEGDTIISTLKYRRAWKATDEEFNHKILEGFVREDTLVGFYFRDLEGDESLLYKYSLNIGDSLVTRNPYIWGWTIRYLVTGIDSVQVDGKYKKRYTMEQQKLHIYKPETWIEGVGSSFGILYCGMITIGGSFFFQCLYENNILIYKDPDNSSYFPTNTALHLVHDTKSEIILYSGTSSNIVIIKSPVDNSVRIYNSCGMYIETVNVLANEEYSLNVSRYSKGIYFISSSTNLSGTKKFIKY